VGDGAGLEAQLAAATVVSRKNTGAGFYADLTVDRSIASPVAIERVVGEVWASIDGFAGPMTFLLFVEDGYAVCLEGATVDDSTVDIDLGALKFKIMQLQP
jgi:hypothetical protein